MQSKYTEFSLIVLVCYGIFHTLSPVATGGFGGAESPVLSVAGSPEPLALCALPTNPTPMLFALVPGMFVAMVIFLGALYGGMTRGLTPFRAAMIGVNMFLDGASTYALAAHPNSPLPHCRDRTGPPFLASVAALVIVYEILVNMYHVLMHLPWARRNLHSYHHELDDPVPILGLYIHPLEQAGIIVVRVLSAMLVGTSAEVFFYFMLGEKATVAIFHERATGLGNWHTRHHVAHDEVTTVAAKVNDTVRKGVRRFLKA